VSVSATPVQPGVVCVAAAAASTHQGMHARGRGNTSGVALPAPPVWTRGGSRPLKGKGMLLVTQCVRQCLATREGDGGSCPSPHITTPARKPPKGGDADTKGHKCGVFRHVWMMVETSSTLVEVYSSAVHFPVRRKLGQDTQEQWLSCRVACQCLKGGGKGGAQTYDRSHSLGTKTTQWRMGGGKRAGARAGKLAASLTSYSFSPGNSGGWIHCVPHPVLPSPPRLPPPAGLIRGGSKGMRHVNNTFSSSSQNRRVQPGPERP